MLFVFIYSTSIRRGGRGGVVSMVEISHSKRKCDRLEVKDQLPGRSNNVNNTIGTGSKTTTQTGQHEHDSDESQNCWLVATRVPT